MLAVADDTYIIDDAVMLASRWASLEEELGKSGHQLRRRKRSAWFIDEEHGVDEAVVRHLPCELQDAC